MIETIKNIAYNQLEAKGYKKLISLLMYMVNKYNWPKIVIDDFEKDGTKWNIDEIVAFAHQLIIYIEREQKLRHIAKIPDSYLEYYFHQVIVTYVATKISELQSKQGISYKSVKQILLKILEEEYHKSIIGGRTYWSNTTEVESDNIDLGEIERKVEYLPKIIIKIGAKQFKKYVKRAVSNIFSIDINIIEQEALINATYSLFDQSKEQKEQNPDSVDEIEKSHIQSQVRKILKGIEKSELVLLFDYFLATERMTIRSLAEKYKIPKSTVQHKINKVKHIISSAYIPSNYSEGKYFLDCLKNELDKLS
jgi:hypothetical protein